MTKGRSNHSSSSRDDYSLPRAKILRGRKNFKRLFEQDAQTCRNRIVSLRYQIVDYSSFGCLMGFIVKKSLGKAHKRNRMKRLLKEAYRLHQYMLTEPLQKAQVTFHGAFMAQTANSTYNAVEQDVVALLKEVRDQLPTTSAGNS
jgi:ribonuclease P protein component